MNEAIENVTKKYPRGRAGGQHQPVPQRTEPTEGGADEARKDGQYFAAYEINEYVKEIEGQVTEKWEGKVDSDKQLKEAAARS